MSDSYWDEENEEEEIPQGPRALREAYKRQHDENASLKTELASLTERVRQQELSKAFASTGIPEKAAALFPKDLDPTEENIKNFAAKYGDLFNMPKKEEPKEPSVSTPVVEPSAQNVSAETRQQFEQMSSVTQSGNPATSSPYSDLETALKNPNLVDEMPYADFLELLRKAGAKV